MEVPMTDTEGMAKDEQQEGRRSARHKGERKIDCAKMSGMGGQRKINVSFYVSMLSHLGWYVVWKLFLSKFKFLREIVGETQAQTQAKLRAPAEDSPTAHAKARHRVSFEHSAAPPMHSTYSQGY
ncbi:unnamed protein product [Lampetra planeri]